MTFILADAYVPLTPIVPVGQVILLVFIILFEGLYIARRNEIPKKARFWWKITVVNLVTTALGVLLFLPAVSFESQLVLGNGSVKHVIAPLGGFPLFALPWLLCYHVSWRTEAAILLRWIPQTGDEGKFKASIARAHRWSYGALGVILIVASFWYAFAL